MDVCFILYINMHAVAATVHWKILLISFQINLLFILRILKDQRIFKVSQLVGKIRTYSPLSGKTLKQY